MKGPNGRAYDEGPANPLASDAPAANAGHAVPAAHHGPAPRRAAATAVRTRPRRGDKTAAAGLALTLGARVVVAPLLGGAFPGLARRGP